MAATNPRAPTAPAQQRHLAAVLDNLDQLRRTLDDLTDTLGDPGLTLQRRHARIRAAVATLALDGAQVTADDITAVTDDVLRAPAMPPAGTTIARPPRRSTWADVLNVRAPDAPSASHTAGGPDPDHLDAQIRTREIEGVLRAYAADDLAVTLEADPASTLAALHDRLTAGLVAAERTGAPRTFEQAVHDASTGRMLYFVAPPATIAEEMAALAARWSHETHPVARAGLVHLDLLRIHPFDAANGRLARVTTALMLREGGFDRHEVVVIEEALSATPLDYHEQVASAARRADVTDWLCWWCEVVEEAMVATVADLDAATRDARLSPPAGARRGDGPGDVDLDRWLAQPRSDTAGFTLTEAAEALGASLDETRVRLGTAVRHGRLRRVRGTYGLRFH